MKPYIDSIEELTPVRLDWMSAAPLLVTMALMLIAPERASTVARSGWGDHLLDTRSMAQIENAKLV
jgi:hypothetical protein